MEKSITILGDWIVFKGCRSECGNGFESDLEPHYVFVIPFCDEFWNRSCHVHSVHPWHQLDKVWQPGRASESGQFLEPQLVGHGPLNICSAFGEPADGSQYCDGAFALQHFQL
jgi:hypothetical protein